MDEAAGGEKPLIVWVEDNRDYQAVLRDWLLPHFDVVTYENGEAFLDDIGDLEPDLVMLDVRLPGPDGFRLCRRLRGHPRLGSVPILFLTSCEDDDAYIAHLDVGGTAFVTKPVEKSGLLSAIRGLVDGERARV